MSAGMEYRADIDGLRALAVAVVVLGHVGVPGFAGGYVGVDVFFVISGYLITSILLREFAEQRYSVVSFYARRVRRLVPALVVVLATCYLVALATYSESSRADFGRSSLATLGFVSNLHFWQTSGYFDPSAHTRTLLHTWSLAVEEQFYLVFPLLLWLSLRRSTRVLKWVVALVALASFVLSIVGVQRFTTFCFYGAPTRAWELMAGSMLALDMVRPFRRRGMARVSVTVGMGMIVASVVCFDATTSFPGPAALVPVLGAVLVIHGGRVREAGGWAPTGGVSYTANTSRGWVGLGLISYSLYLWHWPLLVFFHNSAGRGAQGGEAVLLVVLSIGLAWVTWRFVERPFRRSDGAPGHVRVFLTAGAAIVVLAGLATREVLNDPRRAFAELLERSEPFEDPILEARRLEVFALERGARDGQTLSEPGLELPLDHRTIFGAEVEPGYALWGDSHADALASELGAWLETRGESLALFAYGSNPPAVGMARNEGLNSALWAEAVLGDLVSSECVHTVILHARWGHFVFGFFGRPGEPSSKDAGFWMRDEAGERVAWGTDAAGKLLVDRLQATIDALSQAGKRVILVYAVPENQERIPEALAQGARAGRPASEHRSASAFFRARTNWLHAQFDQLQLGSQGVRVRPAARLLDGERIVVYAGERVLYSDTNHLSSSGVRFVLPLFEAALGAPRVDACATRD